MYINKKDVKDKDYSEWKVITPMASGKGNDGFGNIFIGKPNELTNDSYIFFEVNSKKQAISLTSYLKTKLPNVMLSLRKTSQAISPKTVSWITLVPLDRVWTDDQVYEYLQLTKEQIQKIMNASVKTYFKMNDKN